MKVGEKDMLTQGCCQSLDYWRIVCPDAQFERCDMGECLKYLLERRKRGTVLYRNGQMFQFPESSEFVHKRGGKDVPIDAGQQKDKLSQIGELEREEDIGISVVTWKVKVQKIEGKGFQAWDGNPCWR
jgi:hypothetical protein